MLKQDHWAKHRERGNRFVLALSAWLVKYLPHFLVKICVYVIACYYYLTSREARANVREYQRRLADYAHITLPKMAVFRQFISFASAIADRFAVWQGKLRMHDLVVSRESDIYDEIYHPQPGQSGQIMVTSHLGNVEIMRSLAERFPHIKLNVLMHTKHSPQFFAAMQKNGASVLRIIQVTELDAALMLDLQQRLAAGEWIAIAGDRIPVRGEKTLVLPFLGKNAVFAQGPWLMAGILRAPIMSLFCLKEGKKYRCYFRQISPKVSWRAATKAAVVHQLMTTYIAQLEHYCEIAPLQWFNFYQFWPEDNDAT